MRLTYTICDDDTPTATCDTATVTVTVTDLGTPVAVDDTATVTEDTTVATPIDAIGNDALADNATYLAGSLDATGTSGTVVDNGDGTFDYTPAPGFVGTDAFDYTICDDDTPTATCDTATVTVTVTDQGTPDAIDDSTSVLQDSGATTIDAIANDDLTDDATYLAGSLDTTGTSGSVTDNGDGTFDYTPAPGFSGTDTFDYTICDDDTPTAMCDTATVTVTVVPGTNLPPVATDNDYSMFEGGSLAGNVVADDTGDGIDSDSDGTLIPGATVVVGVTDGSLTLNPDGSFTYGPDAGFVGSDSFTYTVTDDDGSVSNIATVTIVVDAIVGANNPPVAVDDVASTVSGGSVTVDVRTNDSDPDGHPLTVTTVSVDQGGTVSIVGSDVVFVSDPTFTGMATVTYTVCDNQTPPLCDTGQLVITVDAIVGGGGTPVNQPPDYESGFNPIITVLEGESLAPLPLFDPDGDNVTITILSGDLPAGVGLNPDGSFTGIATESGLFILEVEICDDGSPVECVIRPLTINVDSQFTTPDPDPVVTPPGPVTVGELPFTGFAVVQLLLLAVALISAGALFIWSARLAFVTNLGPGGRTNPPSPGHGRRDRNQR